jgi:hypothetical protein
MGRDEYDLCGICKNKGSEECQYCEVPMLLGNYFEPDENKVVIKAMNPPGGIS